VKVLLAGDLLFLNEALARVLSAEPELDAQSFQGDTPDIIAELSRERPDVVLLQGQIGGAESTVCLRAIRKTLPEIPVVALSTSSGNGYLLSSIGEGAQGFADQSTSFEDLASCIREVGNGGTWVGKGLANRLAQLYSSGDFTGVSRKTLPVTTRERDVVCLVALGNRNKQVAEQLTISEHTVRAHLRSLTRKLGASNRAELVRLAAESDLLPAYARQHRPSSTNARSG
jgi:two-component system response regulator DesR